MRPFPGMNNRLNQLADSLKDDLRLFLSISFGVFLFVLFFQPFPLEHFDFNNRLIFVAGLGGIVFLLMVLVRAAFFGLTQYYSQRNPGFIFPSYLSGFIILVLCSVAFPFYLRYVGLVSISFYTMFKVVLICLAPPTFLGRYDTIKQLKAQIGILTEEKKNIQKQVSRYKEDILNQSIEFNSENSAENLKLLVSDIALIKSADNYVEVVFKEGDHFKKKLIRNTMRNIEQQITSFSVFIRCHRICIVNIHYVEKLNKDSNNHSLTLKGYDEPIPVSRQYLLKLKDIL